MLIYNILDYKINESELEAFRAYYHKHYGCEYFEPNRGFIINLFFRPIVQYILEIRDNIYDFINLGLFDESFQERLIQKRIMLNDENNNNYCLDFYDALYYRLCKWICLLSIRENGEYIDIDFSEYPLDDENWEGVI